MRAIAAIDRYLRAGERHVIRLEGRTLCLGENHSFTYALWSDASSSSRYGAGTYELRERHLRLHVGAPAPVMASAEVQPLTARPDSVVLTFVVRGRAATGPAVAVPYASVTTYDKAYKPLVAVTADGQGRAEVRLPRATPPQWLRAESLGFIAWNAACAAGSAAYQVLLPGQVGTPYAEGTVKDFRVGRHTARRLVLREGPVRTTLQRQPGVSK